MSVAVFNYGRGKLDIDSFNSSPVDGVVVSLIPSILLRFFRSRKIYRMNARSVSNHNINNSKQQ